MIITRYIRPRLVLKLYKDIFPVRSSELVRLNGYKHRESARKKLTSNNRCDNLCIDKAKAKILKGYVMKPLAIDRLVHTDNCDEFLDSGYCRKCGFAPSMQDTAIAHCCSSDGTELDEKLKCPTCGLEHRKAR